MANNFFSGVTKPNACLLKPHNLPSVYYEGLDKRSVERDCVERGQYIYLQFNYL